MSRYIRWLGAVSRDDVSLVGGKAAHLGEMARAGLPVPDGFVLTARAFHDALEGAGLRGHIEAGLAAFDLDDPRSLSGAAARLGDLLRRAGLPGAARGDLFEACAKLGVGPVAVRSSSIGEDARGTSFAGVYESYTNVASAEAVPEAVLGCWASMFGERALAYRRSMHVVEEHSLAVIVQKMVAATRAGTVFTADPASGDRERLVVEAAYGLGSGVAEGAIVPDLYVFTHAGPVLLDARLGRQGVKVARDAAGIERLVVRGTDEPSVPVLSDEHAMEVARLGLRAESCFGFPQDAEWAEERGRFFLVQSRAITTLPGAPASGRLLCEGLGASAGIGCGRARVLHSPAQGARLLAGEVLVAPTISPDWVPTVRRAAAVVTEAGGLTSHAALVCREMHIPCVVAAQDATLLVHDGATVTVDGGSGRVSAGIETRAPAQA